jgi:hypothetical protein
MDQPMRFLSSIAVLAGILIACGGKVEGPDPQPQPEPRPQPRPEPPPQCSGPNGVSPGSACSVEGAQCWSNVQSSCTDVALPCTCRSGRWACAKDSCPPCPPPFTITTGASCGGTQFCSGAVKCGETVLTTSCVCGFEGDGWKWDCGAVSDC